MKVHELIAILQGLDGEAEVHIMSQPHYPFEYAVAGIAVRGDFPEDGDAGAPPSELSASDVFILEGSQLRYGDRGAWRAPRRR